MNLKDVQDYFKLLSDTLLEKNLINKPSNIFNIDETGLQLNNRPEYVVDEKGSKNVTAVTSGEKGETISVIVCCNAEGMFIPPTCIFKGKNKKNEYEDGMPAGSVVVMSEKSAYVNTTIFFDWIKAQFVPRKPDGPVVLILDGHSSHVSSVELLEYAEQNNITLLCLQSHTTQFLQPLDRALFKAFKLYYYAACYTFIRVNPTRSINRLQFGKLMCEAWSKAATVDNAVSAFRSTGIFPLNPDIIPEYAYLGETPTSHLEKNNNEIASTINGNENNDPVPTTSNSNEEDIMETPALSKIQNESREKKESDNIEDNDKVKQKTGSRKSQRKKENENIPGIQEYQYNQPGSVTETDNSSNRLPTTQELQDKDNNKKKKKNKKPVSTEEQRRKWREKEAPNVKKLKKIPNDTKNTSKKSGNKTKSAEMKEN
ncbi:CENP-B homolog protein 2-like [Anoplophora glabripennis]|uniref:CENP-B homolog protein 2-like n=1 Tax=Anoplophora glabripennis TaxID=217634 RepID=UPI000C77AE9F|nr:CENP-B homolog protein 2-like [Anoplophora glabripennis]